MAKPRKYEEFPRVVYGPDGRTKTIHSEDERPDGYFNDPQTTEAEHKDDHAKAEEAARATEAREKAKDKLDEMGVKYANNAQTKTLEKRIEEATEEVEEMTALLGEHDVVIPDDANHAKLRELCKELEAYLESQKDAGK